MITERGIKMEDKKVYEKVSYNREYNEKNYDRIGVMVPKGERERIREEANKVGMSVNAFIVNAIRDKIEKGE